MQLKSEVHFPIWPFFCRLFIGYLPDGRLILALVTIRLIGSMQLKSKVPSRFTLNFGCSSMIHCDRWACLKYWVKIGLKVRRVSYSREIYISWYGGLLLYLATGDNVLPSACINRLTASRGDLGTSYNVKRATMVWNLHRVQEPLLGQYQLTWYKS